MENTTPYLMTLRGQSEYGAKVIMDSLAEVGIDSSTSFGYDVDTDPMDMDSLAHLTKMMTAARMQFSIVAMQKAW